MRKRDAIPVVIATALLLLGGIEAAFAWGPRRSSGPLPSEYAKSPYYPGGVDLNLSEDQIKKLQDLRLEHHKEMLEVRNTFQTKQLELRALILSEQPDQVNIDSLVEKMGELWTDMQKKALDYQLKIRDILTEQQWKKLFSHRSFGGKGHRGGLGFLR